MTVAYGRRPQLVEKFDGNSLDSSVWTTFGTNRGTITVANGECTINNSAHAGVSLSACIGMYSNITFPVGTSITVRSKNTSGRHASVIGFGNAPNGPYVHGQGIVGTTWYARADSVSSTISLYDENGSTAGGNGSGATQDLRQYQIFQIKRVSSSQVEFYRNGILEHTITGAAFSGNYPVFFSCDGWYNGNVTTVIDYIVVAE
jgi:hypothetical protein